MRFSILLAIELASFGVPATAWSAAKPKAAAKPAPIPATKPDPAKLEAKALTQAANQDYTLGRFADALDKYSRAYEKFHAPELLFNIGQCHKNLHQNERAVFFFQGYLRAKPDAPNAKFVEEMISEVQAELDRDEAEARERNRIERERIEREQAAALLPGLRAESALQQGPPLYKKAWFWGTVGGVVATAAVITVVTVLLTQPIPERTTTLGNVDLR